MFATKIVIKLLLFEIIALSEGNVSAMEENDIRKLHITLNRKM